jgi:hypothetical protein
LSFWVRSSLTGTFGGYVANASQNRNYPFSYTILSANTWEQKTITIVGDTTGTWIGATNGIGARVNFSLGIGSTNSTTANAWNGTSNAVGVTGATSVVGTNGATFYITGVQLEKGSTSTSFDYRPYGTEFALAQRYYEVGKSYVLQAPGSLNAVGQTVGFRVTKRASPTLTGTWSSLSNATSAAPDNASVDQLRAYIVSSGAGATSGTLDWQASIEL